ncbi:ParB/RepB/Spo0J family partition protein [uncultured Sphingomonas sp.]|uniref:ParB/RepB/Spo0J family partition protein n=1 Tax=uncultured Sphingomonas sp. TaxID=158754 RepID=UPI0035CA5618
MSRPSGLGRGLSALLGDVAPRDDATSPATDRRDVRLLPIDALSPHAGQPRRHFEETALEELAQSIAARGMIQPIVVRAFGGGYQIVAGERRWRAAQRARLAEVPVVVRDYDDSETLQIALLENIQRQDLNAIEEARAYQRLASEFGHKQDEIARTVHKSRSHVANLLRLLDLPEPVQERVVDGSLTMGHARALLGAAEIEQLADQVVSRGLSVRDTEKLARAAKGREPAERSAPRRADGDGGPNPHADVAALEQQLADMLGLPVAITLGDKGGTLSLSYVTLDQLDMLCQRLSGEGI